LANYVTFLYLFICCSEDKIIALYKQLSGLGRGYAIVKYVPILFFCTLHLLNYFISSFSCFVLQCYGAVVWVSGRASSL